MITFKQLKGVLCDNFIEEIKEIYPNVVSMVEDKFEKAESLLDLIHIYEHWGYETYNANETIINTMMQSASFD